MTPTLRNLDRIEDRYTHFEQDQVLTPEQLNGLSGYLDDQERLTRVALVGVGIACGLWATLDGNRVRLSRGVGTTTDGDVAFVPEASFYDRYKPYDSSAPRYEPFHPAGGMLTVHELVREGESDSRALALSGFNAREGRELRSMAAVLYMESYLRDEDLCSGTDCDNRGKDSVHTLRLLLVERDAAAALAAALDTPDKAARTPLRPVAARRPVLDGAPLRSSSELANVYAAACAPTHEALVAAFAAFYRPCRWFIEDFAPSDPAPRWTKALEQIRDSVMRVPQLAQYYYDFLKDLADTWNSFVDALHGDTAVCCPDVDAFPKHLVLGALDPAQRTARGRTGFYPSPMVNSGFEQRARARFLVRKLDTLIVTFAPSLESPGIRITPSAFEDRPLEERAIPFYYAVREDAPVYRAWSYALSRRAMERFNYSYNADRYGAEGAAAAPLRAQLGAFDFFRIEGHLGRPVDAVKKVLEQQIRAQNLPIDIEYVRFDKPPRGWRPPRRFHDLYRFHHLLRADVAVHLADAGKFGESFVRQASEAAGKVVTDQDNGNVPVVGTAQAKTERVASNAKIALQKITGPTYQRDWQEALTGLTQAAAELNDALSPVTKKEFITPLDQLIAGQPTRWLNWIDVLIDDAEDKEAERAQLSAFLREHPGLEHYAGVLRGGTFVLVCDAQDVVVADFMLPYSCCEQREAPQPPPLPQPTRPEIVFEKPIRFVALPDKFRFVQMREEVEVNVRKEVDLHKTYFESFKDALGVVSGKTSGLTSGLLGGELAFNDALLKARAMETMVLTEEVDKVRTQLLAPEIDEQTRGQLEKQLEAAQDRLADAILTTTEYVAEKGLDVTPGTEGARAIELASNSLSKVTNTGTLAKVDTRLTDIAGKTTTKPQVAATLNNMMLVRGAW
jgi:hypothetical protein